MPNETGPSQRSPNRRLGTYATRTVTGEKVHAYVPPPLPIDPPIELTGQRLGTLEAANRALGRLDGIDTLLPDTTLFLYMYVRKEALLSSQIEGTQSSLSDLLLYEIDEMPGVPLDDVAEVSNYVRALTHGLRRIREDGFPLSSRLLREMHALLLAGGRGAAKAPGAFRRSQNWLGGTRPGNATFVPPPHEMVPDLMSDLERFLHDETTYTPPLLKAAVAHVQFESIHPFPGGNGRLGRLLITLSLCSDTVLQEPSLYLSLYFKRNRDAYYHLLQRVRTEGAWEAWLDFFLEGVRETGQQAHATARALVRLFDEDRSRVETLGRTANTGLRLHDHLKRHPYTSIRGAADALGLTFPTVRQRMDDLANLGIVTEVTGKARDRIWRYRRYVAMLAEGTEPL
ncbi:MAG: Fic family protein [Trueperaceae bacterium]|nr:Fic family protein [Trueperaceae bacterium]